MSDDKSGFEVLATITGPLVIMFGLEAWSWYLAHRFAWWTFTLTVMGGMLGYQVIKQSAKELRASRRKRRAARLLGKQLLARRGSGARP